MLFRSGVSRKKNKRGFKTKAEAEQWERDFLQQQQRNLDINFENFVQIYYEDMEHRLRENTMRTKKFIIDLKIIPYFKKKNMNEIKTSDIRAWQNALMKKGYSETYLKTVNNQLAAIFNYAVRYYDLKDNPCRKATGCRTEGAYFSSAKYLMVRTIWQIGRASCRERVF